MVLEATQRGPRFVHHIGLEQTPYQAPTRTPRTVRNRQASSEACASSWRYIYALVIARFAGVRGANEPSCLNTLSWLCRVLLAGAYTARNCTADHFLHQRVQRPRLA